MKAISGNLGGIVDSRYIAGIATFAIFVVLIRFNDAVTYLKAALIERLPRGNLWTP